VTVPAAPKNVSFAIVRLSNFPAETLPYWEEKTKRASIPPAPFVSPVVVVEAQRGCA
jgi:hypothetical protein